MEEGFEQLQAEVDLVLGDLERRGEREDVLVVSANIEHQSVLLSSGSDVAFQSFFEDGVGQIPVRCVSILLAHLDAESESDAIDVADHTPALL